MEIWKKHPEDSRYLVSSHGDIIGVRGGVLQPHKINSGYLSVSIGALGNLLVHRVVMHTFCSIANEKDFEVNHVDGDKLNNAIHNLEWRTSSENKIHALKTGLHVYNSPSLGAKLGKSSKYYNVSYDTNRNKWVACVRHNNKNYEQKRFDSEDEAALHVNYIISKYNIPNRKLNTI